MKDYTLYIDSTADITAEEEKESGVKVIPMEYAVKGKTYFCYPDERELGNHEFFDMMRSGETATTTLINVERYTEAFRAELAEGKDVVYICFSSGLSGSMNCARTAAELLSEDYPDNKVYVVDSLSASRGEGLLVWHAAEQKKNGLSAEELVKWVEDNRLKHIHWFTVDDLVYLRRGGRISAASAAVGGMLNIKPVLIVDKEGHLTAAQKVRGRMASIDAMVSAMAKTVSDPESQTVFIGHTDCLDEAKLLAEKVKEKFNPKKINIGYIGPVVGAHTGPGTLALFFTSDADRQ